MGSSWSFTPFSALGDALGKRAKESRTPAKGSRTPVKGSRTPVKGSQEHAAPKREAPKAAVEREESDEDLFLDEMSEVREIKEYRDLRPKAPPKLKAPKAPPEDPALRELRDTVSGRVKIRLSNTSEYVEWTGRGIRKDLARSLHEGRFAVQDTIDLHGMTLAEADAAVRGFIAGAAISGLFCVKVIHGRGLRSPDGPVLKEALRGWLEGPLSKHAAAYATARGCDGGLGATYVILKSR